LVLCTFGLFPSLINGQFSLFGGRNAANQARRIKEEAVTSSNDMGGFKRDISELREDVMDIFQDMADDFQDMATDVADKVGGNPVFAGKVRPFLNKLTFSWRKAADIGHAIRGATELDDILFLSIFGWGLIPSVQFVYHKFSEVRSDNNEAEILEEDENAHAMNPFKDTILFQVVDHISQLSKIALGVYTIDIFQIILGASGFAFPQLSHMSEAFAKVAYSVWGANRIKLLKTHLIATVSGRPKDDLGRAMVADHLMDAALYGFTAFFVADILRVEMGLAFKSLLGLSSAFTLVLSLASKDLAGQFISGLALTASDKVYEGEEVLFGDGLSGTIVKMGWMETVIRKEDDYLINIPNSELAHKKMTNLSRTKQSNVKQTLHFQYADIDRIPQLLEDIKQEISNACGPELIEDGSRPFLATWSGYQGSHLEVLVDAHFSLPPLSNSFYAKREQMLKAINEAVKKNGMDFKI